MRQLEAVIFDWAGTTVDYGCFAPVEAFIKAFETFGITPTVEEVREPMGMLKRDHIRAMLRMERISTEWIRIYGKAFTEDDVEKVYELSEKKIYEILSDFAELKPYVLETIVQLRKQGIKIGSTTGYTDEMMKIIVPIAREKGYDPDCWFSPNSVKNMGRPYPYMIYKNMEQLGVHDVGNVVKVGDTVADIKEARAAGAISVGIIEGSSIMGLSSAEYEALSLEEREVQCKRVRAVYEKAGADYVIQNMSELVALLKSLSVSWIS